MFSTFGKGSLLASMVQDLDGDDYLNNQPAQEITDHIMEFSHFCVQGSNSAGNLKLQKQKNIHKVEFSMRLGLLLSSRLCLPRKLFCHMCSELFSLDPSFIPSI